MQEVLRQEVKYLLGCERFRQLDHMISQVLPSDPHNGSNGYFVRSLYFDTLADQDFYDAKDGLAIHRKLRLRIYATHGDFALLEMKQKQGTHLKKRSMQVSSKDAVSIAHGSYSCLLSYPEPFARECFSLMSIQCYRPKSITEYLRKAYTDRANRTRLTFDYRLQATEGNLDLFSLQMQNNMHPVLNPYWAILEIKYNEFIPSYMKQLISTDEKLPVSISKYGLSRSIGLHSSF